MELGKKGSERVNTIDVRDIRAVDMDASNTVTFRIVGAGKPLVLDAGSSDHRAKWVAALQEATRMLSTERLQQGDPAADVVHQHMSSSKIVRKNAAS